MLWIYSVCFLAKNVYNYWCVEVTYLKDIEVGDKLEIHCYKHNGHLHRQWDEAVLLEKNKDYMVFGKNRTTVVDSDGQVWNTKEPAILFFFNNRWFNIIGQLKDYGIYFYCNIATPFLIDENVIKYIDYDLDLRVFPNGSFKVLDRMEYKFHKKQMHYSNRLDFILRYELGNLIDLVRNKEFPFDKNTIESYYQKYLSLTKDNGNHDGNKNLDNEESAI